MAPQPVDPAAGQHGCGAGGAVQVQYSTVQYRYSTDQYREYLAAVETTSWVKTSLVKVNTGGAASRWQQCVLELEQCGSKEGQVRHPVL